MRDYLRQHLRAPFDRTGMLCRNVDKLAERRTRKSGLSKQKSLRLSSKPSWSSDYAPEASDNCMKYNSAKEASSMSAKMYDENLQKSLPLSSHKIFLPSVLRRRIHLCSASICRNQQKYYRRENVVSSLLMAPSGRILIASVKTFVEKMMETGMVTFVGSMFAAVTK